MSNKKITDLTELTTPTTDDVFPVVDIATNTTQKVQLGNLPTTPAVTSALASKQATLVSGTNIKTVNGNSVLGSGDINIPLTPPSGVSGAIQFSTGSAFASDATNLFWDDANNRLGVGTNAPSTTVDILPSTQTATGTQFDCFRVGYSNSTIGITNGSALQVQVATTGTSRFSTTLRLSGGSDTSQAYLKGFDSNFFGVMLNRAQSNLGLFSDNGIMLGNTAFAGSEGSASAQVHIKGSGTTSGTTSLLVQNSGGTNVLSINDGGGFLTTTSNFSSVITNDSNSFQVTGGIASIRVGATITTQASAIIQADSTTQGFLPPRMTTTQRDLISSVATGLVLYNTTTNKLQCYNGSTWNDLF